MRIEMTNAAGISGDLLRRWGELQRGDARLHSPFTRPEFTRAVAAVRPGVEIAVLEDAGEVVGFFPFQRSRWNHGRPIGSRMSDFQAVIVAPEAVWDPVDLIRRSRLKSWSFHQLPTDQAQFAPHTDEEHETVFMDLSRGFECYLGEQRRRGIHRLKEIARLRRRAERECGPLQFKLHDEDPVVLEKLLQWKSAQYRRTGNTDVLSFPWVVELVRQAMTMRQPDFGCCLSSLRIGGQLAAAELSLYSYDVYHGWMTAYNRELASHSPGMILMLELARACAASGVAKFELGRNNLPYKSSFATASRPMASGGVTAGVGERLFRIGLREATRLSRNSWLSRPARAAKLAVNPLRGWLAFH